MLYKVKINDTIIRLDLDVAGEGEGSEVLDVGAVSLSEGWDAEIQRWTKDFVLPDESRVTLEQTWGPVGNTTMVAVVFRNQMFRDEYNSKNFGTSKVPLAIHVDGTWGPDCWYFIRH